MARELAKVEKLGPAALPAAAASRRLAFVDNVRSAVIVLVLSMHAADTYSPFGNWYYTEYTELGRTGLVFFATYQTFLQAFFMALLFFIAGYFTPASYDRKGARGFLLDRLVRLGLPTLLFVFVIGPVTEFFIAHSWHTQNSFAREMAIYVTRGRFLAGTGPLWFCVVLIVFSAGYVLYRRLWPAPKPGKAPSLPTRDDVAAAVLAIGISTFAVRIAFPSGTAFYNLQLGDFPSYIVMFALGTRAWRGRWLERVSDGFAWSNASLCLALAVLAWWPMLHFGGAEDGHTAPFGGGLYWQSAAMATWQALICVGMAFAMLAGFRAVAASDGPIARFFSANAFAVYVVHPPFLIGAALLLASTSLPAVEKFPLLWIASVLVSFGLAAPLVRRIPVIGPILR